MEDVIREAKDGPEYMFVSFDIDTLDPAFVPGTGTPEPGGLLPREAFPIVRRLCAESNVVGFDLVELHPSLDPTYATTLNSAHIIKACLTGLAMNEKGLTDPHHLSPLASEHAIDDYYGDQEETIEATRLEKEREEAEKEKKKEDKDKEDKNKKQPKK